MPKSPEKLVLRLPPRLVIYVDQLLATGLFGTSREEVVEELLCMALRDLVAKGILRPQQR